MMVFQGTSHAIFYNLSMGTSTMTIHKDIVAGIYNNLENRELIING